MLQPIKQNFSIQKNRPVSFKNDFSERVVPQRQTILENHLDTLVKEKQEQNRMLKQFAFGIGCLGTAIALSFAFKPFLSNSQSLSKKRLQNAEFLKSFFSLASDKKVPTLENCKSINDNLKTCWKGADADSYTGKIAEQAQVMNKLQATIQEIGEYLVQVGNAYEQAMNENKLN